jgi:ComF family protein
MSGGAMFPMCPADVNEKGARMSTIPGTSVWLSSTRMGARHGWRARSRAWSRALASAVLPPVCCLCGAPGQAPGLDLCDVCTTFLPVLDRGPVPSSGESVPGSAIGDGTLLRTAFLFKYEYPVDRFIRALKFRGERLYARVLGELLARFHLSRGGRLPAFIVPMPLHTTRLRERGFNQAHEIARYASASLGIRVEHRVLVRAHATSEQSGLTLDERRRNVRGAFRIARPLPAGRIALLDDVVTTGSTAMAAAHALLAAGAREIELWAVARVLLAGGGVSVDPGIEHVEINVG